MTANVKSFQKSTIDPMCLICKGKCWVPGDNAETQKRAHAMLGDTIPNSCVNSSASCLNNVKCPSALGLI